MEFNEKLQELRKRKGITQEELASQLYVSRTAVSKWESGRGYPNIESLKLIAKYFSVTVDELLSSGEAISLAEENQRKTEKHYIDLVFGLCDFLMSLLFFLPLFSSSIGDSIKATSLLSLEGIELYLKILYYIFVAAISLVGILTLAMQGRQSAPWIKMKTGVSLTLGVGVSLILIISRQPYASVFAFSLLIIKVIMMIRRK